MSGGQGGAITIAAAQSLSCWGDVGRNLECHLRIAERAAAAGVDFLLFPELSLTGYPEDEAPQAIDINDHRLSSIRTLAERSNMVIAVGAPVGLGRDLAIASLIYNPDGSIHVQQKAHLHPGEERFFVPGKGGPLMRINGNGLVIAICAEASRKSHAEAAVAAGASIYAVSALQSRSAYSELEERFANWARELGLVVLLANHGQPTGGYESAGRSALWTPKGLAAAGPNQGEAIVVGRIHREDCSVEVLL